MVCWKPWEILTLGNNIFFNTWSVEVFVYKPWRPKRFFNLKSSYMSFSFHFIIYFLGLRPQQIFYPFSAMIEYRRRNLTSVDVKFWRLKLIPAMKGLIVYVEVKMNENISATRWSSSPYPTLVWWVKSCPEKMTVLPYYFNYVPTKMKHDSDGGVKLGHSLRRLSSITPPPGLRLLLAVLTTVTPISPINNGLSWSRGLVKLKKIREKNRLDKTTIILPHLAIFWNMYIKTTRKTNTKYAQKIGVEAWPTYTAEFFSDFRIFLNVTRLLSLYVHRKWPKAHSFIMYTRGQWPRSLQEHTQSVHLEIRIGYKLMNGASV